MFKALTIVVFLSLVFASNACAHEDDRIHAIEEELREIKLRLSIIETSLSNPSESPAPMASGEAWKSVANWRRLSRGMGAGDVRAILGEPYRVEGGAFTRWFYPNNGRVIFWQEAVDRWEEPEHE